ncbi:FAD-dependent thymidylate synthase [Corynebacterium striatum]
MVNIAKPEVSLIAFSECDIREMEDFQDIDVHSTCAEDIIEFAGRACYQSFHKPNPATRVNKDYLNRTLFDQGHWSIAEHASATVYITGVSRAFTHELIRHRHLSFSQLSQRFVDESEANIVVPPALRDDEEAIELLKSDAKLAFAVYSKLVERLIAEGKTRKQAREAARCVLPNMAETRIVVTGNLRAWHEVIERRTAPDVDAEMVEVMGLIREALREVSPVIFGGEHNV